MSELVSLENELLEFRRKNEILKKATKEASLYVARYLPPDKGISAKECISGVLGALDNDDVIEALDD